jgi:hypothetical protein
MTFGDGRFVHWMFGRVRPVDLSAG